jgi:hypothetical protein
MGRVNHLEIELGLQPPRAKTHTPAQQKWRKPNRTSATFIYPLLSEYQIEGGKPATFS